MADDKKNVPDVASPTEAPAPTVEKAVVPEQPAPEPALTDAEAVMLEHEGRRHSLKWARSCLIPPMLLPTLRWRSLPLPKSPRLERNRRSRPLPARMTPPRHIPARSWILPPPVTRRPRRRKKAVKQKPPTEKDKAAKPGRGRPPKESRATPNKVKPSKTEKAAPEQTKPPKAGKTHAAPEEKVAPPVPEVPPTPRDATRAEKEEIVYLDLSDLHPFKDHLSVSVTMRK